MELEISGFKCDHCDYTDESVPFAQYKESIGKPCPNCGESLLTQEEYDNCLKRYESVATFNKVSNILKWINPLHYWRLVFGDNREVVSYSGKYPKRNINK